MPPNRPLGVHDDVASGPGLSARQRAGPLNVTQRGVYSYVGELLKMYGLESLIPDIKDWMENGISEDEIVIKMQETDQFKARFPALELRRKKGLAPMSPAEYIEWEDQATKLLRSSGLPRGFYDSAEDFTNLISGDVSIPELQARVENGYRKVAQMNKEVKDQFKTYFGVGGDDALAAFYLDPEKSMPVLERMTGMAEIGGAVARQGYGLSEYMARRLYGVGVTAEQATGAVRELDEQRADFIETIDEDTDLTLEETGLNAKFGTAANDAEAIRRRRLERAAEFQASGGAAAQQSGLTGAGAQQEQ